MATITGKRFQMTDGAASPINLFPYTVSEAVYGLNNSISNAISSALSTISLSTYAGTSAIGSSTQPVYYNGSALVACDLTQAYLPLAGGTMGNTNLVTNLNADLLDGLHATDFVRWYNSTTTDFTSLFPTAQIVTKFGSIDGLSGDGAVMTIPTWIGNRPSEYYNTQFVFSMNRPDFMIRNIVNGTVTGTSTVYTSTNSNLSIVPWACSTLTASGDIHTDTRLTFNDMNIGWWDGVNNRIESASRPLLITSYNYPIYIGRNGEGNDIFIDTSGNVGIGTTSPSQALHVDGNILSTGDQIINSDLTMKMNLKDVTYSVSDIAKCRAVTFDWKDGHGHSAGSIAQDWKPLIPELVHGDDGNMTLAYGQIALVNSILEAREIERLKERVAELENQLKMRS